MHDYDSDGFVLSVGMNIPDSATLDADECKIQSKDNSKMPVWKDKNDCVECTVNKGTDMECEILKSEVLCTKKSVEIVF